MSYNVSWLQEDSATAAAAAAATASGNGRKRGAPETMRARPRDFSAADLNDLAGVRRLIERTRPYLKRAINKKQHDDLVARAVGRNRLSL